MSDHVRPLLAATGRPPTPAAVTPPPGAAWAPWAFWVQAGFDTLRHQHALAVRAGWLPRSVLGGARFEAWLGSVERLTLGPLARRV